MKQALPSDGEVAAAIVADFLKQDVQDVAPILGLGSVNKIFVARSGDRRLVVRLCQRQDSPRALAFYEKEAWCVNAAAGLGIPGPAVLAVGSWDGRPYMLESLVPGRNGEESPTHIVPHYDFIALLREHGPAGSEMLAFRQGYGMAEAEYARLLPELRSLLLLKEFDLTRWAIERCPERIPEIAERARTALQNKLAGQG